ncbi:MAG: hypothetical protein HY319_19720 [Armatimonadetes bacterium]|nr:hypothetical protein [Armatimonadota bacterium]
MERGRALKSRRAVSLVELVLALGVAAVVLLTLAVFIGTVHRNSREGKSHSIGSTLAVRMLEKLHSDPDFFEQVLEAPGSRLELTERQQFLEEGELSATKFRSRVSLLSIPGSEDRYFDALVQVDWAESGRQRSLKVETYVPDPR